MNLDPIMEDKELPGPCKGRWCERPNDRFGGIRFSRCAFRKSYPDVMVVQPRQDWDGYNDPCRAENLVRLIR